MNTAKLYAALIGLLVFVVSLAGSFWLGTTVGKNSEIARVTELKEVVVATREDAKQGAADAIAKIQIRNTTVQGRVQTIIKDNPVYGDCKHNPDALRLLNEALTGTSTGSGTGRDGSDSVPSTVSPIR